MYLLGVFVVPRQTAGKIEGDLWCQSWCEEFSRCGTDPWRWDLPVQGYGWWNEKVRERDGIWHRVPARGSGQRSNSFGKLKPALIFLLYKKGMLYVVESLFIASQIVNFLFLTAWTRGRGSTLEACVVKDVWIAVPWPWHRPKRRLPYRCEFNIKHVLLYVGHLYKLFWTKKIWSGWQALVAPKTAPSHLQKEPQLR